MEGSGHRRIAGVEFATGGAEVGACQPQCSPGSNDEITGGIGKFLKHADCADAYKDKDFVVTAKLEIPGDLVKVVGGQSDPAPKRQKLNVLENMYNKMSRPDFTLVFEGEEIPCHKIVLAAASPVFEAMVENKHREAIENRAATGWQNLAAHRTCVERVFANFCLILILGISPKA